MCEPARGSPPDPSVHLDSVCSLQDRCAAPESVVFGYRFLSGAPSYPYQASTHTAPRPQKPGAKSGALRRHLQSFLLIHTKTLLRSPDTKTPANAGLVPNSSRAGRCNPPSLLQNRSRLWTVTLVRAPSAAAAQHTPGPAVGPAGGSPAPFRGDADSPPVPPLGDPASQAGLRCPLSWEIKTLFVSVIGCFIPNGLRRGSKAVFLTADAKDD